MATFCKLKLFSITSFAFSREYSTPIFNELAVPKSVSYNSLHLMKAFKDMIFISEVLLQSKIAQRAFERLQATHKNFDHLEAWFSIHQFLFQQGIYPGFFGQAMDKLREKRLREKLQAEADNILSDRKFRNHFEHYDERIEERFNNRSGSVCIDLARNPSFNGDFNGNNNPGISSFNNSLVFCGEKNGFK